MFQTTMNRECIRYIYPLLSVNWEFKPAVSVVILATFQLRVRSIYRVAQKNVYTLWHEKYYSVIVTSVFIQKQNWYERCPWIFKDISDLAIKDISASQERLCHLLRKHYKSACAICWENIIRAPVPSVEKTLYYTSHPEIEISFKFIPKILMSKGYIHFLGHSVLKLYKKIKKIKI